MSFAPITPQRSIVWLMSVSVFYLPLLYFRLGFQRILEIKKQGEISILPSFV
jgi:hypothetical protein